MPDHPEKTVEWMGSTLKDLRACPDEVKDAFGYVLHVAQVGGRHPDATPMKGALRGVMEIRVDEGGDTYRTMYTAKLAGVVYVLNVFQKKSTQGIKTPQHELELTLKRLRDAQAHYRQHYAADE